MKSFNVDAKMKDRKVIESAILATCESLRKSKWKRKKERAKRLLAEKEIYIEKTLNAVENFEKMRKLQELGLEVPDDIRNSAWTPKGYSTFTVMDGPSRKERDIVSVSDILDKIIHQLWVEVGKPVFMKGMYRYSCGSIPGRGTYDGVRYLKRTINRHTKHDKSAIKYGAVADVVKCYQSLSHTKLKQQIRKKFRGKLFYWASETIIDTYHFKEVDGGRYGIPIGFAPSQWLCNFALTEVDHEIKANGVQYFVRYVDDFAFFGRSKKMLHKIMKIVENALARSGLALKKIWQVFRYDYIDKRGKRRGRAFDILGYRFFRDKTILRKRNALAIKKQVSRIQNAIKITAYMARSLMSRMGALRHCDSLNFYNKNIKPFISMSKLKGVIRIEDRKRNDAAVAV